MDIIIGWLPLTMVSHYAQGFLATNEGSVPTYDRALTFLWIAIILLAARLSRVVVRFGQPSVLGELLAGVILGNLFLLGFDVFEPIKSDPTIAFLAQLGIAILLFQIGLESNIKDILRVGIQASLVATIGVVVPFILGGLVVGLWLLPGLSVNSYLFLGATLSATSIGITARIFQDLGRLRSKEAQIVLGAAVIDDILGLIVLAVVSAIVISGAITLVSVEWIIAKAAVFFVAAIMAGQLLIPRFGELLSRIHDGIETKFMLAISFGLAFAYLAEAIGLSSVVGAFAAGLALDPLHFRYLRDEAVIENIEACARDAEPAIRERISRIVESAANRPVEDIIQPLSYFLAPIFFVTTGMALNLQALFSVQMILITIGITITAILGKVVAGIAAGKARKLVVGCGMIPRGEVGLIFAAIGRSLGVLPDGLFSVVIIVVIVTTLVTPPLLALLLKQGAPE